MTNCDQIVIEAARLKALFTKCTSLKAMDLRAIVDLIESVNACAAGGGIALKTVNGNSLIGAGNIVVTASSDGTDTKVTQGTNITITGNGSVSTPYVVNSTSTAQVNSDWNSVSGVSQILNKPSIVLPPLEAVVAGTSFGLIVRGRTIGNYGPVGDGAFDVSYSDEVSTTNGATGINSFASGINVKASGYLANSIGYIVNNEAISGLALGMNLRSRGYTNSLFGIGHDIKAMNATVVGQAANIVDVQTLDFNNTPSVKPMFIVGNGTVANNDDFYTVLTRSDAFKVMMDGLVTAPSLTKALLSATTDGKTLVTKEWASTSIGKDSYIVSTLPTGVLGDRAIVTDATAPTYLGALTGGGVIKCPVWHNGTSWVSN